MTTRIISWQTILVSTSPSQSLHLAAFLRFAHETDPYQLSPECAGTASSPPAKKCRGGLQDDEDYAEKMKEAAQQYEYMKDRMDVLLLLANHIKD